MPITLDFTAGKDFDFAKTFAERFHQTVTDHKVAIPDSLGKGYIKEVYLDHGISLCIHQYYLKETLELNRLESDAGDILTIKFTRNPFFRYKNQEEASQLSRNLHTAEVSTSNLFAKSVLAGGEYVDFLVITLSRKVLAGLLRLDEKATMQDVILHNPSFVFYETIGSDMGSVLLQLHTINGEASLSLLQYEACVYKLIYLLFSKLLNREATKPVMVNESDAEKIYLLKEKILEDLSIPPKLPKLAHSIGMSETKMKKLFQYVFGQSIYSYFQSARMNEAARLLTRLSVSETGYKLGFTNLSHFARLFGKHFHSKPKQYQNMIANTNGNGFHE